MLTCMQSLPLDTGPYYALHGLTLVSYLLIHHIVLRSATEDSRSKLLKWELQAVLSLIILLSIKYVRKITREAFLVEALFYSKVMVALLAFMLDWRLLAWYLVLFAILYLLCKQPVPELQGKVTQFTPLQLENFLTDGNQNTLWLVEFGAVWSPRCVQLMQHMAHLSMRYAGCRVQFARIDLGRFPSAADKYGIQFGVALRQLPTYILFQGANEVCRVPEPSYDETTPKIISEAYLIRKFGLDTRLLYAMSDRLQMSEKYRTL